MGVTCGFVVPSLRGALCTPCRSVRPLFWAGSIITRSASARTAMPSRVLVLVQACVVGSCASQCATDVPTRMGIVSCSVFRRSVFVSTS